MINDNNKKIQWGKIIIISFIFSIVFLLALIFGIPKDNVAPLMTESIIGVVYVLLPFISALLIAFFVKNRRILHFFITLVVAWVIIGVIFNLSQLYFQSQNKDARQQMKERIENRYR